MQKRLVLINVGVVIIGLIAAALLAMPLVRNLYLEEFHRTLDSAVMLLTTDGDEIQEDRRPLSSGSGRPCSRRARISA